MSKRDFFLMALANLLWAGSCAASKIAMRHLSPLELVLLRYGIALAVLVPLTGRQKFGRGFDLKDLGLLALLGGVAFAFSPWLQATGIHLSRAVDASLIIALEPVATALLAWAVLKERLSARQKVGFAGALAGFCILSGLNPLRLGSLLSAGLIGKPVDGSLPVRRGRLWRCQQGTPAPPFATDGLYHGPGRWRSLPDRPHRLAGTARPHPLHGCGLSVSPPLSGAGLFGLLLYALRRSPFPR
ncbi:MAG: DMT family transporter [Armatimonadetes bacterium]|nr:DMT family transporter [Armatimonadota bacterium]